MTPEDKKLIWYENEFAKPISDIISEMLDSPHEGIFQTSRCYEKLNNLVTSAVSQAREEERKRVIDKLELELDDQILAAQRNADDSKEKVNKEYYNGLATGFFDAKTIFNQKLNELERE